jgi:hypothetical protein
VLPVNAAAAAAAAADAEARNDRRLNVSDAELHEIKAALVEALWRVVLGSDKAVKVEAMARNTPSVKSSGADRREKRGIFFVGAASRKIIREGSVVLRISFCGVAAKTTE